MIGFFFSKWDEKWVSNSSVCTKKQNKKNALVWPQDPNKKEPKMVSYTCMSHAHGVLFCVKQKAKPIKDVKI